MEPISRLRDYIPPPIPARKTLDGIVAEADDRGRTAFRLNFLSFRLSGFRISTSSPFLDKERIKEEGKRNGKEVNLDFGGEFIEMNRLSARGSFKF